MTELSGNQTLRDRTGKTHSRKNYNTIIIVYCSNILNVVRTIYKQHKIVDRIALLKQNFSKRASRISRQKDSIGLPTETKRR